MGIDKSYLKLLGLSPADHINTHQNQNRTQQLNGPNRYIEYEKSQQHQSAADDHVAPLGLGFVRHPARAHFLSALLAA